MNVGELTRVWERYIQPRFDIEGLEATVRTGEGTRRYVNLDNAATTKPFASVTQAVLNALHDYGSVHRGAGQHSKSTTDRYERSRIVIRDFVRAGSDKYVLFTKNTTESINHAAALLAATRGKVLVSDIEHSSNLLPWLKHGEVLQYPTHAGVADTEHLQCALKREQVKLLSITGASNVTGYKPPIHALADLAHGHGASIFVDACQLVPHHKIDMRPTGESDCLDWIAFSGHKMYAPFGAGVLIGPKVILDDVEPYQPGGGNLPYITRDLRQMRHFTETAHDPGTPNAIGAIAIAAAIHELEDIGFDRIREYEAALVQNAYERLSDIPGAIVHSPPHGTVVPFDIRGMNPRAVAETLATRYGVGTRAGSFCTYEFIRKLKSVSSEEDTAIASEVAQGDESNIPGVVRASFSIYNRPSDVDRLVDAVREVSNDRSFS